MRAEAKEEAFPATSPRAENYTLRLNILLRRKMIQTE